MNHLTEDQKRSLPGLYCKAWKKHNLCKSKKEAEKVLEFNPFFSFASVDPETGKVFGLINAIALPFTPEYIAQNLPTYKKVEEYAFSQLPEKKSKTILCFSLVAKPGIKIKEGDKSISPSRFAIREIRRKFSDKQIAVYTRLAGVPRGVSAKDYYQENRHNLSKLGSVGMHAHLGAELPPIAIIENARPDDLGGGKANIVMVYSLQLE